MNEQEQEVYEKEKTKELHCDLFGEMDEEDYIYGASYFAIIDIIRSIIKDCRARVSREFVEEESYRLEWTDKDELRREDKLPTTLRNAGVEVEK